MKLIYFISSILFLFSMNSSGEIYKHTESNGTVTYSDQPAEGAEEIKLEKLPAWHFDTPKTEQKTTKKTETQHLYQSISILSPANNTALNSTNGSLSVSFAVKPALKKGDSIAILVDGSKKLTTTTAQTIVPNLERGTHQISAQIVSSKGNALISSSPISITIHKPSALRRSK